MHSLSPLPMRMINLFRWDPSDLPKINICLMEDLKPQMQKQRKKKKRQSFTLPSRRRKTSSWMSPQAQGKTSNEAKKRPSALIVEEDFILKSLA